VSTRPSLAAETRTVVGKHVAILRRAGVVPAVVYGHGHASEAIQLDARELDQLRRHIGRNTIIDLAVGGRKPSPVLIQSVHEHPVSRRPQHVDFYVVKMTEEMTVEVPVVFVGASVAVERGGGTLLHLRDAVQVRALPADLPSAVEVDVTPLEDFETTLHVSDLQAPPRVTILTEASEPVVRVQAPRVEAEVVPAAEEVEAPAEEAAPEARGGEAPAAEVTAEG
jgi:large subunit ribosomal protein L25